VKLSVVVPCYNEEDVVPQLYEEVVRETDRVVDDWELVLVHDGSSMQGIRSAPNS
jgi:dolichol-phosphate mannosyltransferase